MILKNNQKHIYLQLFQIKEKKRIKEMFLDAPYGHSPPFFLALWQKQTLKLYHEVLMQ